MASRSYAGLLLIFIIMLLGIQYSTANLHEGNYEGKKRIHSLHTDYHTLSANGRTINGGRKMLQGHDGKTRSNKPAAEVLDEEADEVADLMRNNDYKGGPRGRRKPPIHNNVPTN